MDIHAQYAMEYSKYRQRSAVIWRDVNYLKKGKSTWLMIMILQLKDAELLKNLMKAHFFLEKIQKESIKEWL